MTIFSLAAIFAATYAWFSMNKEVGDSGTSVNVGYTEYFSKISYHQFLEDPVPSDSGCNFSLTPYVSMTYNARTKTFNTPTNGAGQNVNDGFDLVMEQYDPMNKHKPVLVLAELSQDVTCTSGKGVRVNGTTSTLDFLGRKDDNTHQAKYYFDREPSLKMNTIGGIDYYPLSSVVCFKARAFSQTQYNTWVSGESAYVVTGLNETENPKWLGPADHNFSEADVDSDVSYFYNESIIYSSDYSGDTTVKYIAIVVDYYDLAIEYIYSTYLGNDILEGTYSYILHFACDWVWEIG